MNNESLSGIWESEKLEAYQNGAPTEESVRPGLFTFTKDGRLSVVSASNLSVMAYVGSYRIEKDFLKIRVESCVHREMEGTEITRKILTLDGTHLILESLSQNASLRHVLTWKKKLSL